MTDALPLEKLLAEVDSLVADLDAAIPRLTLTANYGERTSSGSKTAPAPVNVDAVSAKYALHTWLVKTCALVGEPFTTRPHQERASPRTPQSLSSHLLTHMTLIVANGWAATFHTQLAPLMRDCNQAANTTAGREFAGTCQTEHCGTELWTTTGNDTTRCKTCGTEYTAIQNWRTQARDYARNQEHDILGYPSTLSQRLSAIHGETITPEHIRLLASKGLLVRANPETGSDGKKLRAMYKLGDVKALIREKETA